MFPKISGQKVERQAPEGRRWKKWGGEEEREKERENDERICSFFL